MTKAIKFLLDNAGPVIRYRTLSELISDANKKDIEAAEKELLNFKQTKKRFQDLQSKKKLHDFNGVHGAANHHLENALPMLIDFGIKKGFKKFDILMQPILKRVQKQIFPIDHVFSKFIQTIIYPFLYKAGFREKWLVDFLEERLEILSQFTAKSNFDIYDDTSKYCGIPKTFQDRRIIRQKLYKNGDFKIPLIYDIYAFTEMIKTADKTTSDKIETVINYIRNPKYSKFDRGYGVLVNGKYNYLAMGWDAKLPERNNDKISPVVLQRIEFFAHFKSAQQSNWFKNKYSLLQKYKTENDTYCFPKELLPKKKGCWVRSRHLDLGENRRKNKAYEIESTFRMLKLKRIISESIKFPAN